MNVTATSAVRGPSRVLVITVLGIVAVAALWFIVRSALPYLQLSQAHYGPNFWPRRWGLVLHVAGGITALTVGALPRPPPRHPPRPVRARPSPAVCWARHDRDDPRLGRPLCLDCYDHDHQVVWNLFSGALWHRTKQAAERHLAKLCRPTRASPSVAVPTGDRQGPLPCRRCGSRTAKPPNSKRRGAVHFHALLRLDGVDPHDPDAVIPPPAGITVDDLDDAIRARRRHTAFTTPAHPDRPDGWPITWGDARLDIRPITLRGDGDVTDEHGRRLPRQVRHQKHRGHRPPSTRLTADTIDHYADPDGDHIARLIDACWRLGRPTHTPTPLRPARHPDRPDTRPTSSPGPAPTAARHTRLAACPAAPTHRQAALTPNAPKPDADNPYARLRRWAHMLGFGGHFLTKARRYSITFQLLRDTRVTYRRAEHDQADADTGTIRTADHLDEETTLIVGTLTFAGAGWHTTGDALLANTAAALARSRRASRPRRTRPRNRRSHQRHHRGRLMPPSTRSLTTPQ